MPNVGRDGGVARVARVARVAGDFSHFFAFSNGLDAGKLGKGMDTF